MCPAVNGVRTSHDAAEPFRLAGRRPRRLRSHRCRRNRPLLSAQLVKAIPIWTACSARLILTTAIAIVWRELFSGKSGLISSTWVAISIWLRLTATCIVVKSIWTACRPVIAQDQRQYQCWFRSTSYGYGNTIPFWLTVANPTTTWKFYQPAPHLTSAIIRPTRRTTSVRNIDTTITGKHVWSPKLAGPTVDDGLSPSVHDNRRAKVPDRCVLAAQHVQECCRTFLGSKSIPRLSLQQNRERSGTRPAIVPPRKYPSQHRQCTRWHAQMAPSNGKEP